MADTSSKMEFGEIDDLWMDLPLQHLIFPLLMAIAISGGGGAVTVAMTTVGVCPGSHTGTDRCDDRCHPHRYTGPADNRN